MKQGLKIHKNMQQQNFDKISSAFTFSIPWQIHVHTEGTCTATAQHSGQENIQLKETILPYGAFIICNFNSLGTYKVSTPSEKSFLGPSILLK